MIILFDSFCQDMLEVKNRITDMKYACLSAGRYMVTF